MDTYVCEANADYSQFVNDDEISCQKSSADILDESQKSEKESVAQTEGRFFSR